MIDTGNFQPLATYCNPFSWSIDNANNYIPVLYKVVYYLKEHTRYVTNHIVVYSDSNIVSVMGILSILVQTEFTTGLLIPNALVNVVASSYTSYLTKIKTFVPNFQETMVTGIQEAA